MLVHAGAYVSSRLHLTPCVAFFFLLLTLCVRECLLLCQSNCTLGGGCETSDSLSTGDWCVLGSANYHPLCAMGVVMRYLLLCLSEILLVFFL